MGVWEHTSEGGTEGPGAWTVVVVVAVYLEGCGGWKPAYFLSPNSGFFLRLPLLDLTLPIRKSGMH